MNFDVKTQAQTVGDDVKEHIKSRVVSGAQTS